MERKKAKIERIIGRAEKEGRKLLLEYEAGEVFTCAGVPVAPGFLARTVPEAMRSISRIGFPVVMKVMSPQIVHKSDAGAIKVGIVDEKDLRRGWKEIEKNARSYVPKAEIEGIFIQKMLAGGREVIVGTSKDPQFGPVVMFGLGGIFVEVFKDVAFRVAPINREEALRMIREIHSLAILKGVRGEKPIDFSALASVISRVSRLAADFPQIAELDANPVRVDEKGAIALDARIILE